MPSSDQAISRDDPRLNEILAKYLQAVESGQAIDVEQFVREHAEHEKELREFFADKRRLDDLAGRDAVGSAARHPVDAPTLPPNSATHLDAPTLDSVAKPQVATRPGTVIRYFGEYELLEEIARGGMGVVYKARQVKLNRIVALKMILSGQLASQEDVQRFYTEAEAAAGLDHPGIVPIFEVGEHEGQHYFSMGFVDGESLSSRLADGPLPPREAAELVCKVADAVQYAHECGVIHRDLKPANVLLQLERQSPETRASAAAAQESTAFPRPPVSSPQPKVTDFGLAKKTTADSNLTGTGQILGTPSYMPPEQAAGRVAEVRETADVYSLGAILYATLTGRPPFQADNPLDTLLQVMEREPVSPRTLNPAIPLDLETICLKCLQKDRRRRYRSAAELADELRRYLDGKPILARPVGRVERTWRWCRRNPVVSSLLAAVTLSLAGGTIISTLFALEARHRAAGELQQRREAERQTAIAKDQLNRAEWLLYANDVAAAQREGELNNPALAIRSLDRTPVERRGWEYHYLRHQHEQSLRLSIPAHDQKVLALAVSDDGQLIASAGRDRRVKVWNASSGSLLTPLAADQFVTQLTFSRDRQRLAGVATDGKLRVWELPTGRVLCEVTTNPISGLAAASVHFTPDGQSVVTNNKDATLKVWDLTTGAEHRSISLPATAVAIAVSPDGKFVASATLAGNGQSELRLFRLADSLDPVGTRPVEGNITALDFDRASEWLAVGTIDPSNATGGMVRVWQVGQLTGTSEPPRFQVAARARQVGFTADGRRLITVGTDGGFGLFDAHSGTTVRHFQSRSSAGQPAAVSLDAGLLITANDAGVIELWNTTTGQPPLELPLPEWGYSVAFSPDGRLVAGGSSKTVAIWDTASGTKFHEIPAHEGTVHTVAFHPDGDRLLSGSWDGSLRMWNVAMGREQLRTAGGTREYDSISVSPRGDLIATGNGFTPEIRLLNAETGTAVTTLSGATERADVVAFAADGVHLATGGEHGEVLLWDVPQRLRSWSARLGKEPIRSLAVSADNRWVVALSTSGSIALWDVPTGKNRFTIEEPGIYCIRFTPDHQRLVGGGGDATLKFWSVETGQKICTITGHKGRVFSLACSPDGLRLATTGDAGAVFLWDAGNRRENK